MFVFFFLVGILAILFYKNFIYPLKYWKRRNVEQGCPLPFVGDQLNNLIRKESNFDLILKWYNSTKGRFYGVYQMTQPLLLIKDPEIIKNITIKDFDHFVDHRPLIPLENDPLWSKNLIQLTGDEWRNMRSTLSAAFTSSKMRLMYILMKDCVEDYIKFYLEKPEKEIILEMKDSTTRFANDVIASCAFGIEIDSLKNPKNDFFLMGKDVTDFSPAWKTLRIFFMFLAPKLSTILKMKIFSNAASTFFTNIIKETIKIREEKKIIRPDLIHLLMQARHGQLKYEETSNEKDAGFSTVTESNIGKKISNTQITDLDITAQALIFFFAGFDTITTTSSFMAYELAINPEIQTKLRNEIDNAMIECNNDITYDHLMKLKYLDMVISETLRKWPAFPMHDRKCVKDYTIPSKSVNESTIQIKNGEFVVYAVCGFHRDPKYFPNPDKFDPERFNEMNKHKIDPFTYFPFGLGPRACIGSRFALLEMKILFFYLLHHFELTVVKKTVVPIVIDKRQFNLASEHGYWLGLKKRK